MWCLHVEEGGGGGGGGEEEEEEEEEEEDEEEEEEEGELRRGRRIRDVRGNETHNSTIRSTTQCWWLKSHPMQLIF